ncbi:MAG: membrane protein insertase YidC [Flavobacteriia bacterium]|nr:membrane protein insertase YidC [Flavobacteriia bacterium]
MENRSSLDRNQIIGFLLITAVLFYFMFMSKDEPTESSNTNTEQVVDEATEAETTTPTEIAAVDSSSVDTGAQAMVREAEFYTIENEVLKLQFTNKGAQIVKAQLKDYKSWDSTDLCLVDSSQTLDFSLGNWNSKDAWFDITERTAYSLELTTSTPHGPLSLRWELKEGEYQTDFVVSGQASESLPLSFNWVQNSIQQEKSRDLEGRKTQISYWEIDDNERESLSENGVDSEEAMDIRWLAHQDQFFSTIITAEGRFDSASMKSAPYESGPYIKAFESRVNVQEVNGTYAVDMNMYFGPNKYDILKEYDMGYDKIIDFGWGIFGWISRGVVVRIFNWLDGYGLNYGLIILLMALMIKLTLSPLTFQSYKSMAKMRVLRPEIEEINEKHKDDDPLKKQQATMELYRKAGVNPLGGCIPQLVQLPILFAMFRFFPASIELRQESFWWATDLSSYDSIATLPFTIPFYGDHVSLFTILMAISTFMYSYMNQQMTGSNSQMPQLKYIIYFMPFMLLFFFNSYAAALSYYYMISNLITFGQQYAIRAFINEDALHAKLQENKKKPKKQNKFQKRLSDAMEQQQQANQDGNRRMRRMK